PPSTRTSPSASGVLSVGATRWAAWGTNALSWGPDDRNGVGSSSRTFSFPATTSSDQLELDASLVDSDVLPNRIGPDLPELHEIGPDDHLFREVTRHDEGVHDRHALQLEEETDHHVRGESPRSVAQLKRPRMRRTQQPSASSDQIAAAQR